MDLSFETTSTMISDISVAPLQNCIFLLKRGKWGRMRVSDVEVKKAMSWDESWHEVVAVDCLC